MAVDPNSSSDFPFEAELQGIFDKVLAEQEAYAGVFDAMGAELIEDENKVMAALLETGDPLLTAAIAAIRVQRATSPDEIEPVNAMYARFIMDESEFDLPPELWEALDQLKQALFIISTIGTAVSEAMSDTKQEVQLKILEDDILPPSSKVAALQVVDKLVPGLGFDTSKPDEVAAALAQSHEEREKEKRMVETRKRLLTLLDEETDFLEAHHIHPADPAWEKVRRVVSIMLSATIQDGNDAAEQVLQYRVNEPLAQLRLNEADYQALKDRLKRLYYEAEDEEA